MRVYTYSEARQKLSEVLEQAESTGKVLIRRKDGRIFALRPEKDISISDTLSRRPYDLGKEEGVYMKDQSTKGLMHPGFKDITGFQIDWRER